MTTESQIEFQSEFQFGLKRRLYNWNMRSRRELKGWRQQDLGAMIGCSGGTIGQLENLRLFPQSERAQKIAEILECPVEILFPEWLKAFKLESVPKAIEEEKITLEQAQLLRGLDQLRLTTPGDMDQIEDEVDREILTKELHEVMNNALTPREKRVLELRFGLSEPSMTCGQVGEIFNVTGGRIQQIEAKALRKLRHPGRSRKLKDLI